MACPSGPATAVNLVESRFNTWNLFATQAFDDAATQIDNLMDFELTFNGITPSFSVDGQQGTAFQYQRPPDDPDIAIDYSGLEEPAFPNLPLIAPPDFRNAPENTATKPVALSVNKPTLTDPTEPGDAPTLSTVTLPTAPDASSLLPTVPTLSDITLPTAPSISLPTFTATAPTDIPAPPLNTFEFEESDYTSTMYEDLLDKIGTWMGGTQVIPTTIWNSMWDRTRSEQAKAASGARAEAKLRWSKRGFKGLTGMLNADLQRVTQDVYNQASENSREITVKNAEFVRDDIRFAVQQGITLEGMMINLYSERQQRAYDAAKFAFQASIDIFNANVTLYNTQYQAYKTEADVYKTRIEAELSRLEEYKAQLDAQRLIAELNQQDIALYNAQLQSVLTHIEIYKGELAGVQAQVQIDQTRVQTYIAEITAYEKKLDANLTRIKLYAEELGAEGQKFSNYQTEVNAFAAELKAYDSETDFEIKRKEIELAWQDAELKRYTAKLEKYKAQLQAEIDRVRSGVGIYDGKARIYSAEIGQEESRVRADAEQYRLAIEEGRADAQLQLESGRTNLEYYVRTLQMELSRLDTLAKTQSGLAQAALSALDVRASISSSANDNFNYDCG